MSERGRRLAGYLTALSVLGLDQITKRLALGSLELHQPEEVFGSFLRLTLAWNRGAAFSMSWGGPWVLACVTAAAVIFVASLIWRQKGTGRLFTAAMGAVLGGAAGNLLDRLLYGGGVVDFIDAGFTSWRWPTFNVADIGISVGGVLLVILYKKNPGRTCPGEKVEE